MLEGIEIQCYSDGECMLARVGHIGFRFWSEPRRPKIALRDRMADAVQRAAMRAAPHYYDPNETDNTEDATIERAPVSIPRLDLTAHAAKPTLALVRAGSILTPRELEVMTLAAEGLSNKHIATALGIADHTAKFHVSNAIVKLHARNRTHAAVLCVRRELAQA